MTLRSLEIFNAVTRTGSMSEAAKELCITQSSVSQVIIEIEKEFNIVLFERIKRKLHLTKAGEDMLIYVKKILLLNSEMVNALTSERNSTSIKIGATVTVGSTVITSIIKLMNANDYININVTVANTEIIEKMLINNEIDIALVEGIIRSRDIVLKMAMADKLVFICSNNHKFYGKKEISIKDLEKENFIVREPGSGTRDQLLDVLKMNDITPNITFSSYTHEAIIHAVEADLGISIISERLVKSIYDKKEIWIAEVSDVNFSRSFKLAYHKDKHFTEQMKKFVESCYQLGRNSTSFMEK